MTDKLTVEEIARTITGPCTCTVEYMSRGRKDPACRYCDDFNDMVTALLSIVKDAEPLVRALENFLPKKDRGSWDHSYGCPAEVEGTDNVNCTCGTWADIDKAQEALTAWREKYPKEKP